MSAVLGTPPLPAATGAARTTVLVVDDEASFQETIARFLPGYRRLTAYTGGQAREQLAQHHVDVVLLDLGLPDTTGRKLIDEILSEHDVEIIVITCHSDLHNAVDCIKAGAFDFLAKSYESYQRISDHVERALEHRRRRRAQLMSRADDVLREGFAQLERTRSTELQEVVRLLRQAAGTPLAVLVEGESGVGKELLARYVHLRSTRAAAPFVPVNVAAIPPSLLEPTLFGHEKQLGTFELADGGTLFLDEIGELDGVSQAKLLRALQEREIERVGGVEPVPVDVRVVAATHRNLEDEVTAGRFREDLFFRLNVVRARVPPLRQRRDDIPELIDLLAARHARALNRAVPLFTPEAVRILCAHGWSGNVRELEHLVMRMVALHPAGSVGPNDIPVEYCFEYLSNLAKWSAEDDATNEGRLYQLAWEHFERYFVRHIVDRCGGSKTEAARVLGVSYATVKNKTRDGDGEST